MIEKLEWDSKFFGKKIGRLTNISSEAKLKKLLRSARASNYSYLSYRAPLNISVVNKLELNGFYITDIGVVFERDLKLIPKTKIPVREAGVEDMPFLKKLTKRLFIYSRFYNDQFFTKGEAEKFYLTWIENMVCDKRVRTFLVECGGFITCKRVTENDGNIPLIGVIPIRQDKGIGQSLMYEALKWFKKIGVDTVNVRTQANNVNAINFYKGLGFMIKHIDITMGLILDKGMLNK